jgi:phosphatidylinositol alpha-mannosyltransferase
VYVGIFTEYYYPSIGGVQEHVHHFALEARRLGHRVKIVTSEMPDLPPPGPDESGPDVVRIGRSRPLYLNGGFGRVTGGLALSGAVRDLLARERFDLVHVHCPLTPVLPWLAIHHARVPVVGTFHTNCAPGLVWTLTRRFQERYLARLDVPIAVSRTAFRQFERMRPDFEVVPNGVDAAGFGRGRRLARFDDGRFNVLWVGRLEPRNGLGRMLRAFALLRRRVDARLLVLGDGPLRPRYEAMVPRELAPDVVFAGAVRDERPDWYASAHVYCAPTTIATFGVTLLEAMAAGKPVLASDIEAFREVVRDGEGELLPTEDAARWAAALEALARDGDRAAAQGARGRLTAARYDWSRVTQQVLEVYRRAAGSKDVIRASP